MNFCYSAKCSFCIVNQISFFDLGPFFFCVWVNYPDKDTQLVTYEFLYL